MKVVVLSGTGWVGHNTVKQFTGRGHEVIVTSRGVNKSFPRDDRASYHILDRNDTRKVDEFFKEVRPEVVIDIIPCGSALTTKFVEISEKYQVKHFINCSSTGVYTPLEYIPADEDHPWNRNTGVNFIGKLEPDVILLDAFQKTGFPGTVIRPSYIQGKGMLPLTSLGNRARVFWQRIAENKSVPMPNDGKILLQPVDVRDVARSFVAAIENPEKSIGETFIISGENAITILDHIKLAIKILKSSSEIVFEPADTIECSYIEGFDRNGLDFRFLCEHMCFSIDKAKNYLGWKPKYNIEQSLSESLRDEF